MGVDVCVQAIAGICQAFHYVDVGSPDLGGLVFIYAAALELNLDPIASIFICGYAGIAIDIEI